MAAVWVSAPSRRAALRSTVPALAILLSALLSGYLMKESREGLRGSPLYLYLGLTLLLSWGVLVVVTAAATKVRWTAPGALLITCVVALIGFSRFVQLID